MRISRFLLWSLLLCCISASGQSKLPDAAPQDPMALRTAACTHCHGEQGRAGPDGYYPRLAGKPALYLYNQLKNFKDERRHYQLMAGLLAPLSDAYLWDIAQYFSSLDVPYPAPTRIPDEAASLRRGKTLALEGDPSRGLPACTQCHGPQLMGHLPATPGLLGLPRDYLNAQLGGWQTGQRRAHSPDCMGDIAKRLRPEDVQAVTGWLAQQPVPRGAKPAAPRAPVSGKGVLATCGSERSITSEVRPPEVVQGDPQTPAQRGAYLARIGNCAHCHTAPGAAAYAGGRGISTPFGTVFSSNITPDVATGIGSWSRDDFWNALHRGQGKDGRLLNPAFPYTSYTLVTREDADALFAFLQTNPPVAQANRVHDLRWPYGTQVALRAWRWLYFKPAPEDTEGIAAADRGAYLVRGLGHCAECHGARNRWGGQQNIAQMSGGVLPGLGWVAPALQGVQPGRQWTSGSLRHWLRTGTVATGTSAFAGGPMAEVIHHSTQYLSDADALAMAQYLASPTAKGSTFARATARAPSVVAYPAHAAKLYEAKCAQCHGKQGEGVRAAMPALAGNPTVVSDQVNNLVLTVLYGGFAPSTAANPKPYGMPPFVLNLSDAELAALLTYVRNSWGNQAPAVTELDIHRLRNIASR